VIPDYPDPQWKLPEAQKEIPYLKELAAKSYEAEVNALRTLLADAGSVDHFHFAGHGQADVQTQANPSPVAKIMMRGEVLSDNKYRESYLDSQLVEQHASLTGPEGNRPLVVLNACQIGRARWELTSVGGFAQAFLGKGAGAFVGTLWSVGDQPAHTFTEAFYKALVKGGTIAQAAIAARKAASSASEGTWLAYVVYGRPNGRVKWDGKKTVNRSRPARKAAAGRHS
jgi:CHAT domain-containing protein